MAPRAMEPVHRSVSDTAVPQHHIARYPPGSSRSAAIEPDSLPSHIHPGPAVGRTEHQQDVSGPSPRPQANGNTHALTRSTSTETPMTFTHPHVAFSNAPGDLSSRSHDLQARIDQVTLERIRRLSQHQSARRRATSNIDVETTRTYAQPRTMPPALGSGSLSNTLRSPIPYAPPYAIPPSELNRPLPQIPDQQESASTDDGGQRTQPRWQPDSEVTSCPLCHNVFTFWFRKHHCRKCGRIVCANCSPHRITIPRKFVVQPPEGNEDQERQSSSTTNSGHDGGPSTSYGTKSSALDEGLEVRLCNPCILDPNSKPFANLLENSSPYNSYAQRHWRASGLPPARFSSLLNRASNGEGFADFAHSPHAFNRSRGLQDNAFLQNGYSHSGSGHTLDSNIGGRPDRVSRYSSSQLLSPYGSAPNPSHERHANFLGPANAASGTARHRYHASLGSHNQQAYDMSLPRPVPPPAPRLREEDECPICHGALPDKGPDGSETAREEHINSCIELYTSGPKSSGLTAATDTLSGQASSSLPQATTGIAGASTIPQRSVSSTSSSHIRPRRRTTGMVVFSATEKDCVGEGGQGEAECVICFEEFAIGDEMGRLECLCKFHKVCIRQWWDTKGVGACPVHQEPEEA